MCMTDPVADMLTRIRNAGMAKHQKVDIPSSNLKVSLATVLRTEGFIKNFKVIADSKQGILRVYLKFIDEKEPVINEIKRISKPGGRDKIHKVKNGLGVAILSTSKGLVTDKTAREMGIGGEILCTVW